MSHDVGNACLVTLDALRDVGNDCLVTLNTLSAPAQDGRSTVQRTLGFCAVQ